MPTVPVRSVSLTPGTAGGSPLGGARLPLSTEQLSRLQLADILMREGADSSPILSNWQGLNRVAQALVGAGLTNEVGNEERRRSAAYQDTLARALKASEPQLLEQDIWDPRAQPQGAGVEVMPTQPLLPKGAPIPGTGGMGPMANVLTENPDTAPVGLQLRWDMLRQRQEHEERMALERAKRDYQRPELLSPGEAKALGLSPGTYQRSQEKGIQRVDNPTGPHEDALTLGYPPGSKEYVDYIRERTLPKPPTFNLADQESVARMKLRYDVSTKRIKDLAEQVDKYREIEPQLQQIAQVLEGGQVDTNIVQNLLLPIENVATALGFRVNRNLGQAEQLKAAMEYLVPRMRVLGSGSSSNLDMRSFRASVPNYQNINEANELLARGMLQVGERNRRVLALMYDYIDRNDGSLAGFEEYADKTLGSIFPKVGARGAEAQALYDSLPAGTVYWREGDKRYVVKR